MIKRLKGGWQVDIQPGGRGRKRYRKTLPTKAEALRWEAWLVAKVTQEPDWEPPTKDLRRLSDLIEIWYGAHGQTLKDGSHRRDKLVHLVESIGNPSAEQFTAAQFIQYRTHRRLAAGISEATTNREHAYLRSLFNELTRLGHWTRDNPLEPVYDLLSSKTRKARATICRLVLSLRSQFFQSLRHFSSHAKERSTTQRFGMTANV